GGRIETANRRLIVDLSVYHYQMDNGIVQQRNDRAEDYYRNAGEIKQQDIETSVWTYVLVPNSQRFILALIVHYSESYIHYRFVNYDVAELYFSGNKVTDVPHWLFTNTVLIRYLRQCQFNLCHTFTSNMQINDENCAFSE